MNDLSLIIKDNKSLFFKEKFVFLWNLSALGTSYEKKKEKASFRIITKTSISVQDTQILCHIVSHVTSFNY